MRVKYKLIFSLVMSFLWVSFAAYVGYPWYSDMVAVMGPIMATMAFSGIALIPGWATAFVIISLLIDNRPKYKIEKLEEYPAITVLIAAYDEQDTIVDTLDSVVNQNYPNKLNIIVANDGSGDNTEMLVNEYISNKNYSDNVEISLLSLPQNRGKAGALNFAKDHIKTEYFVTVDADSCLYKDALVNIISHIVKSEEAVVAVAGSILVKNTRHNWVTRMQDWDYFHGIAVIKRVQSLYQGTLVAQGAFSAYKTSVISEIGGWTNTVGEDIVLTWAIREKGYKVGYSETAFCFTNAPKTIKHFVSQRARWARGLIEAFKKHPSVIWTIKKNTPFIWYNLTFPFLDFCYLFFFVPGVLAALFFKFYLLAGIMTLLLLPLLLVGNVIYFQKQRKIFVENGLKVRRNISGLLMYMTIYQVFMTYASLKGYTSEILKLKKKWGTRNNEE